MKDEKRKRNSDKKKKYFNKKANKVIIAISLLTPIPKL